MNTNQNEEQEITYDNLANMSKEIVGAFVDILGIITSNGPIIKFLHAPEKLHFKLAWLRDWDYSEGSGNWGEKEYLDGYEFIIPRNEIQSISGTIENGILILLNESHSKYYIRTGRKNIISSFVYSEIVLPMIDILKSSEQDDEEN